MFDPAPRFSAPDADVDIGTNLGRSADLITASIAARCRRQHPELAARVAQFNAEAERIPKRYWGAASALRRYGYLVAEIAPAPRGAGRQQGD